MTEKYNESEFRSEELQRQVEAELKALNPEAKAEEVTEQPEEVVSSEEVPSSQYTEVEVEQMEKGWKPKDQFIADGGKEEDWVPAKAYKKVGEIIEAKRNASKRAEKEIEDLTKTVKQLIDDQRLTKQKAYEQAQRDLAIKKLEKIREGDVDAVMKIEQEQTTLAKEAEFSKPEVQQQTQQIQETPLIAEWKEKNKSWLFENSPDPDEQAVREAMRAVVAQRAQYYMNEGRNVDDATGLQDIDNRLKKAFPSRFGAEKPKAAKFAASTTSAPTKGDYSLSRLSYDQRSQFNAIHSVDPTYTVEEYVKQLELVGRLK